jgi:sialate O-acetylesterase
MRALVSLGFAVFGLLGFSVSVSLAEVKLPAIIGSNMVLQRNAEAPLWGWAGPGEAVTVSIPERGQKHETKAGPDGKWLVRLAPLKTGDPISVVITGENKITLSNVLVGEVWVCSGQSNMQMAVQSSRDADLESLAARFPQIRLIQVRTQGAQAPLETFEGAWAECSPDSVRGFSAVGYFYGRQLHQTLDVPVGLIDNAWGGSSCESWVRRDLLDGKELYAPLMQRWEKIESEFDWEAVQAKHASQLKAWKVKAAAARKAGQPAPRRPRAPRNQLTGQHRPANLFNARLMPVVPFAIRGAVWYQGESNASRAYQYRDLFPLMIQNWRDVWGQGEFPFYYVQLADFRDEKDAPAPSDWAELREAQTMTMDRLEHVGEAVIIDIGEGKDIHPKNKQGVAKRLARWALANEYQVDIAHQSPRMSDVKFDDGKVVVTFEHVAQGLRTFDTRNVVGFAVAGEDKKFYEATGTLKGTTRVEVVCAEVEKPVAVRYAWADNPICNLFNSAGLPATPGRSDTWKGSTADNR